MKLSENFDLFLILRKIAEASQASPKDFPVLLKLAVAENLRLSLPDAKEFELQRNGLIEHREKSIVKDEPLDSPTNKVFYKAFYEELKKLEDAPSDTKFRCIYESDLKEAPLTIEQISVLQFCGIIIKNPEPPK